MSLNLPELHSFRLKELRNQNQSPNNHKVVRRRRSFLRSLIFLRVCNQLNKPYPQWHARSLLQRHARCFFPELASQASTRTEW